MLKLPPDITFVIQLVSFFIFLFIMKRLLFTPFAELLEERERKTEGASAAAGDDEQVAEELKEKIARQMAEARSEASAAAEEIRREAREEEARIFDSAKAAAADRLAELRSGIDAERNIAEQTLKSDAGSLAREMVQAVIGSART